MGIIYAYMQDVVCVSLDYSLQNLDSDPMMIQNGSPCEKNGVRDLKSIFKTHSSFLTGLI